MRLAAGILFYAKDTGKILLVKRSAASSCPHTWSLAGGKVDNKMEARNPKLAARREAMEEIGFTTPVNLSLIHITKRPGFRFFNYLAIVPSEFSVTLNEEHTDAEWFDPETLPNPLHHGVEELFSHYHFPTTK